MTDTKEKGVDVILPLQTYQCVPLIISFVVLLPLFLLNSNVIKRESESSFDFDNESSCRRKIFFALMTLQFLPFMGSLSFLFRGEMIKSPLPIPLDVELVFANFCCMFGALLLKIGTYKPKGEDSSF